MIISHGAQELPAPAAQGSVVSVGVFDGVHAGHQAILAANCARAAELGARPAVVTFANHPKQVTLGRAPRTLTSLEHRLELFARAGIEQTLVLIFDAELMAVPAGEFANRFLVQGLGARSFVLGFDSKFGQGRRGTPTFLRELGFPVEVVEKVDVAGRAVSSTAIREAVELGDLAHARSMLGRPVSVFGEVVRGDEIGRTLGFPTANLDLHHELHPPTGVYAARVRVQPLPDERAVAHGELRPAVVNIGLRPTLKDVRPTQALVEVHLLDFQGDLYGAQLEVLFEARLRDEQRFAGVDALRQQIGLDVQAARDYLRRAGSA